MTCEQFKKIIGDYLDEEVTKDLFREVQTHLNDCGSCSVEVDTLRKTIHIYRGALPPISLSMAAKERLFRALSYEYRNPPKRPLA